MKTRRKLFSSTPRKKLFSTMEEKNTLKTVMCMDCGYKLETASTTTKIYCPKCGGTRFNVYSISESPEVAPEAVPAVEEKSFTRKSVFGNDEIQKEFTEPCNDFERSLKDYSGKTVEISECHKLFSMTPEELIEKNYADPVSENEIQITPNAFLIDKLFSKLIISVTKELDLDTTVPGQPKESIIDSLASSGNISPKGIILIKKAHMISPITKSEEISENPNELSEWVEDSGIIGDMKIELGDKSGLGISEFMDYLNSRYPDAPKGLIDYLVSSGVVKIQGNHVDVVK